MWNIKRWPRALSIERVETWECWRESLSRLDAGFGGSPPPLTLISCLLSSLTNFMRFQTVKIISDSKRPTEKRVRARARAQINAIVWCCSQQKSEIINMQILEISTNEHLHTNITLFGLSIKVWTNDFISSWAHKQLRNKQSSFVQQKVTVKLK